MQLSTKYDISTHCSSNTDTTSASGTRVMQCNVVSDVWHECARMNSFTILQSIDWNFIDLLIHLCDIREEHCEFTQSNFVLYEAQYFLRSYRRFTREECTILLTRTPMHKQKLYHTEGVCRKPQNYTTFGPPKMTQNGCSGLKKWFPDISIIIAALQPFFSCFEGV